MQGCLMRGVLAVSMVLISGVAFGSEIPADSPIRTALERAAATVDEIVAVPAPDRTFDNTVGRLDDLVAQLENDANFTMFLAYVSTDADERARGSLAEEHYGNWMLGLFKNDDLYAAVREYAKTAPRLVGEQKTLFDDLMVSFRRAGMELSAADREKLQVVQVEINRLGIQFEKNIREDESRVPLTREELTGMDEDFFASLTESSGVYLCDLSYPTFLPIMDYCDNETTRKKMWVAYKRRGGMRNVKLIEQIISLRAKAAKILGYQHPADYETEVRMAKNAATVMDFYKKVRPLVRRKAEQDFEQMVTAKREHTGDADAEFYPWDTNFYEKRLLRTKYAVDSKKVAEYFPLENVMKGLFGITQSLYGLEYRDVTADASSRGISLWHEDAQAYDVFDRASGKRIGMFAIDLFPRANKFSHAAQWGIRQHKVWSNGKEQSPIAILVCNFPKPTGDKPALMPHSDVETFFHEFGHCLHTLLSTAKYATLAGTNTTRDFVEAPSQMFEEWVWDTDVLRTFARHYKTDEPIPTSLVRGMVAARNLNSGMKAERQFYYGLVDMAYHTDPDGEVDTTAVAHELASVEMYDAVPETYFQAAFGHLVGYQAGYYGYMWSKVYAADMFQRFRELGMLKPEAGAYYRDKVLSRGGTMDELDMLRDYLGREPDMGAFLKALGLEE